MPEKEIIAPPVQTVSPNLANYEQEYKSFKWEQVLNELSGFP
nr:hypothetical protein [Aliifodinibius sp. S!AR15-10]